VNDYDKDRATAIAILGDKTMVKVRAIATAKARSMGTAMARSTASERQELRLLHMIWQILELQNRRAMAARDMAKSNAVITDMISSSRKISESGDFSLK